MKSVGESVRQLIQANGFDFIRFRSINAVLAHHQISLVFDVGANAGQYATKVRAQGYRRKIVSFEPQANTFACLTAEAKNDPEWTTVHSGLGAEEGTKQINVYSDPCLSSMLTLDEATYMNPSELVGTETIQIRTLDQVFDSYAAPTDRVYLKIDTQGYERAVLEGAAQSLPKIIGVQMEMSLTPIYANQPRLDAMIQLMRENGFVLWQIQRGICDLKTGQEFECDGIFINEAHVAG